MAMLTFLLVLLSATAYEMSYSQLNSRMQCEDLREQMCQGLPYKKTFFPNIFNHLSQEKASQVFSQYSVLITANCFRDMKLFLCSLFFPICTKYYMPFPPCRRLCKKARAGCLPLMKQHNHTWPMTLSCKQFPKGKRALCIDRPDKADKKGKQGQKRPKKNSGHRKKE